MRVSIRRKIPHFSAAPLDMIVDCAPLSTKERMGTPFTSKFTHSIEICVNSSGMFSMASA